MHEMLKDLVGHIGLNPEMIEKFLGSRVDPEDNTRLGLGLPTYLVDEDSASDTWALMYGGKANFLKFFKSFMISQGTKVPKGAIKFQDSYCIELSMACKSPVARNMQFRFGNEKQNSFSEKMLAQLKDFPEYNNFSLEESVQLVENTHISHLNKILPEKYQSISECADMMMMSKKNLARVLRLSKLDSYLSDINNVSSVERVKLVLGVFGMFDTANLPLIFIRLMTVYPDLLPFYSDVGVVKDVFGGHPVTTIEDMTIACAIEYLEDIEDKSERSVMFAHYVSHALMQKYCAGSIEVLFAERRKDFTGAFLEAKKHVKILKDVPESFSTEVGRNLSPVGKNLAMIDLNILQWKLEELLKLPFIRRLFSKDLEKEHLLEALKSLDPGDANAAIALSDKMRELALQFEDAPIDVQKAVDDFSVKLDYFIHEICGDSTPITQLAELEILEVPDEALLADSMQETVESNMVALELYEYSESARKELEAKIEEQAQVIKAYRAKEHQYRVVSSEKSLMPSTGDFIPKESLVDWVIEGVDTPERILKFVEAIYPDRVVVLDSAYKSAQAASDFKNPSKLRKIVVQLATQYLDDLSSGVAPQEAKQVFGSTFRSFESDTVNNNSRLKSMREFDYNGERVHFTKHIAIGNKYGTANTIRMYFEIIDGKLVISYCGEHLTTAMTT